MSVDASHLIGVDPLSRVTFGHGSFGMSCRYCQVDDWSGTLRHKPSCVWRQAQQSVIDEALASVSVACTGLTASWCPIHGACVCPRDDDGVPIDGLDDPCCPLHRWDGEHPFPAAVPDTIPGGFL